MATREAIRNLMENWLADPHWDIEDTEGFEGHRAELRAFREAKQAEWARQRERELGELVERIGAPNVTLARYLERLERRLQLAEERISRLEEAG
jgi:hypothetical protein